MLENDVLGQELKFTMMKMPLDALMLIELWFLRITMLAVVHEAILAVINITIVTSPCETPFRMSHPPSSVLCASHLPLQKKRLFQY